MAGCPKLAAPRSLGAAFCPHLRLQRSPLGCSPCSQGQALPCALALSPVRGVGGRPLLASPPHPPWPSPWGLLFSNTWCLTHLTLNSPEALDTHWAPSSSLEEASVSREFQHSAVKRSFSEVVSCVFWGGPSGEREPQASGPHSEIQHGPAHQLREGQRRWQPSLCPLPQLTLRVRSHPTPSRGRGTREPGWMGSSLLNSGSQAQPTTWMLSPL